VIPTFQRECTLATDVTNDLLFIPLLSIDQLTYANNTT